MSKKILFILCLWLAFWLRIWGLDFGLPYEFHPDEHQYVDPALLWHTSGQINLGFINPPLFTYILTVIYWPWLFLSPFAALVESVSTAYFLARLSSAGFALGTVALVYPLGRRLYNQTAGLLSMVLLAVLFLPAREAHFATNGTIATFLVLLAIYFSLDLWQQPRPSTYLKTGLVVGLAAAAKLTGGVVILSLIVTHFLALPRSNWFKLRSQRSLLWAGLVAVVTFGLVSAHLWWRLPEFVDAIREHLQFGTEGYKGLRMAPASGWIYYLKVLSWGMGWPMLLAAVATMVVMLWQRHRWAMILTVCPIALFAYLGGQKILFARFILPAVPPLVLFAGIGLAIVVTKTSIKRFWLGQVGVIAIVLAPPLFYTAWFDHLLTLPDTRQLATEWFAQQFPEETVVVREGYSILPATLFIQNHWPYKLLYLDERGPTRNNIDHYLTYKTEVIALSNFTYERVRADPAAEAVRRQQLAFLTEKAILLKEFNPYRRPDYDDWFYLDQLYGPAGETLQRIAPGPLIRIYRLPYENQPYSLDKPPIPVPVEANFADKLILLGYDLPVRRAEPGGAFPLTLYWQASTQKITETLVIFNRLLDNQQRSWGGYDRWPQETANTKLWHPGEVVVDTFNLPVAVDAPDGVYTIDLGLYNQADPTAAPLPLIRDGVAIDQNSVRIGPVKIGDPPSGATLKPEAVKPQHPLSIELGRPPVIALRGYTLSLEPGQSKTNSESDSQNLKLELYWASLAATPTNWSIFVHLRNQSGETVAQKDGPAGGGRYPTSLWDPGEILVDELTILLLDELPAGEYSLVVGLYNLADGTRLTVPDSRPNEIILTTWVRSDS